MAQDEPFGAKIIPKYILWVRGLVPFWVLRHSFLSLTGCLWLYNIQLKTSSGVLFLPPSDAYVRSFLYLLYTLIKLCYTKALSDQACLWPRIEFFSSRGQESRRCNSTTTFQYFAFKEGSINPHFLRVGHTDWLPSKEHSVKEEGAGRDKKAFLSDQCKEIEENDGMGKTRAK